MLQKINQRKLAIPHIEELDDFSVDSSKSLVYCLQNIQTASIMSSLQQVVYFPSKKKEPKPPSFSTHHIINSSVFFHRTLPFSGTKFGKIRSPLPAQNRQESTAFCKNDERKSSSNFPPFSKHGCGGVSVYVLDGLEMSTMLLMMTV